MDSSSSMGILFGICPMWIPPIMDWVFTSCVSITITIVRSRLSGVPLCKPAVMFLVVIVVITICVMCVVTVSHVTLTFTFIGVSLGNRLVVTMLRCVLLCYVPAMYWFVSQLMTSKTP